LFRHWKQHKNGKKGLVNKVGGNHHESSQHAELPSKRSGKSRSKRENVKGSKKKKKKKAVGELLKK